jgi:branched-chain amino acid transport system substrate-binding protein
MLKSVFIFYVTVMLLALVGTASAASKAPIRIADIDPYSGPFASVGLWSVDNLKFNASLINKNGGINGHKIEIVPLDNALNPKKSLIQFHKAVNEGIRYIAQNNSDTVASALLNAVNKHNRRNPDDPVLYLNYGAIGDEFTNSRCSFWHFLFDANVSMKMNVLTDWIAKQKKIHKVYLFNQDYSFGHSVAKEARKMLKKKRPDIKIVGDVFIPLGKVKDFTPYVTRIKASGADAVITGNWGQDVTLLVKAAADSGLNIPFLTYYGGLVGTIKAVGKKGVDRLYEAWLYNGDFKNPKMAKRNAEFHKKTGFEYGDLRGFYMIHMLKAAAEKADSIDPTKVAFALEGLKYKGPVGLAFMRAKDHQIEVPMFISVLKGHMKYGAGGTPYNYHAIAKFSAKHGKMPTTCKMHRPKR